MKHTGSETRELKQEASILLWKMALTAIFLLLAFTKLFGILQISDNQMNPGLKEGDLVLYYRIPAKLSRSDVAVVDVSGSAAARRVAAVNGDTVDIQDGGIQINGYLQQEPEIISATYQYREGIPFPITLEKGQVFVLADARTDAEDSRLYGPAE
ncbi:MAG: signal peptidase I, partial [Erysipelotrichia bacterium]|nr:signal peptidase I [Erysipelotrichia bacterium]